MDAGVTKRQKVHWILDFGCLLTLQIAIKRGKIVLSAITNLMTEYCSKIAYFLRIQSTGQRFVYILGCCFAVCWKPSVLGETSITLHEFIKGKMYRKPLFPYPDYLEHAKISQLIQDQVRIIFVASFSHVWLDTSHVPIINNKANFLNCWFHGKK